MSDLDPKIANRAIFLDFEGFQEGDPVIAGWQCDGVFQQVVFDHRLESAAAAKKLVVVGLYEWGEQIVNKVRSESRKIIAYSGRERDVMEDIVGDFPDDCYVNLLPLLKKLRYKHFPDEYDRIVELRRALRERGEYVPRDGNRLIDFCELLQIDVPSDHAAGRTTARLATVIGQLERRGSHEQLTPVAKAKWTKLLKHNRFDVEVLVELARRIWDYFRVEEDEGT